MSLLLVLLKLQMEKCNPGLTVNVYGYEEKKVHPLRLSKTPQTAINLMLLYDAERDTSHWVWIKHFSRLCANLTKHNGRQHYCFRCLSGHNTLAQLNKHLTYCNDHEAATAILPNEGTILTFNNHHNLLKAPYIVYADCESLIRPMSEPIQCGRNTTRDSEHVICSARFIMVCSDGTVMRTFEHRGEDAMEMFLAALEEEEEYITEDLSCPQELVLTRQELQRYREATRCWICEKPLPAYGDDIHDHFNYRVRDHDHISGVFRGAAHQSCNLKLRIQPATHKVPVVFHNLKGYDSHHIISTIGKTQVDILTYTDDKGKERTKEQGGISAIAINPEKMIGFCWRRYRFIDSLAFLNASLDRLAQSTPPDVFHHTSKRFQNPEQRALIMQKGVYPYEYMSDYSKFDETALPPREAFHSTLSGTGITEAEYAHAQAVWDAFHCRDLGDYHDIYLETGEVVHFVFDKRHCTYTYDGMILCLCNHDILRVRAVSTCTYLTPYVLCVCVCMCVFFFFGCVCRCASTLRHFREFSQNGYEHVRFGSCELLHAAWFQLGCSSQGFRCTPRPAQRHRHASVYRTWNARWGVHGNSTALQSK